MAKQQAVSRHLGEKSKSFFGCRPQFTAREARAVHRALEIIEGRWREPGIAFSSVFMAQSWLKIQLSGQEREIFMGLFLDSQHRLITADVLASGTIDAAAVYPREVLKRALAVNAAAVILAHNHPSGQTEPSPSDHSLTKTLRTALAMVDVKVLDHIIVGGKSEPLSFASRGWL